MATPSQVFKNFEREDLLHIIKYRNIEVVAKLQDEPDKDLVKLLAEDVSATGLQLLFESLSKETLTTITTALKIEYPGYDEDVKPSIKLMSKRLLVAVGEASSAKNWFTNACGPYLAAIVDDLELEDVDPKDKTETVKAIIAEANAIGTENCLSAFSVDFLKRCAEGSGLKVYGGSREKILSALSDRTDMEKPKAPKKKKKKTEEQPSESKPKIAKGISKVDLNSWYYAADLQEWCKDKDLPYNLAKKLLIKQILDFLDGKEIPKKEKKEPKEPKKKVPKKRRTRAPIGQAKRPKRKPKKKKAAGEAEGAPPAKKPRTTKTTTEDSGKEDK